MTASQSHRCMFGLCCTCYCYFLGLGRINTLCCTCVDIESCRRTIYDFQECFDPILVMGTTTRTSIVRHPHPWRPFHSNASLVPLSRDHHLHGIHNHWHVHIRVQYATSVVVNFQALRRITTRPSRYCVHPDCEELRSLCVHIVDSEV